MARNCALVLAVLACFAACACTSAGGEDARPSATAAGSPAPTSDDAVFTAAVSSYRRYLEEQSAALARQADALRVAIAAGQLESARNAYAAARAPFQQIAAIASYLPAAHRMDAQFLHVPVDATFGFHRIEHALWSSNTTQGLLPTADQLLADARELHDTLPSLPLDALRMTEAYESLDSHPVITDLPMEPDSRIDLVDHNAQVEGSRTVFDLLRPAIAAHAPELASGIAARFADADAALVHVRRGTGFVASNEVAGPDRQSLNQALNDLSSLLTSVKTVLLSAGEGGSKCYGGDAARGCHGG